MAKDRRSGAGGVENRRDEDSGSERGGKTQARGVDAHDARLAAATHANLAPLCHSHGAEDLGLRFPNVGAVKETTVARAKLRERDGFGASLG